MSEMSEISSYLAECERENSREETWLKLALKYSPEIANVFTRDTKELEAFWENIINQKLALTETEIIKKWRQ
jgi:hypothetical protein